MIWKKCSQHFSSKKACIFRENSYYFSIFIRFNWVMIKLFGVGDESQDTSTKVESGSIDLQSDEYHESEPEEVGQIALDIFENHESVCIIAPVAGVELADIDISVHDTTLTISWVRNRPKEFYEHAMEVKNEECFWGKFLRNIILSENMDFSAVEAVMENNLLVVRIPKIRFDSQNIKINKIAA